MTEVERIGDQLRRSLEGDAWHGPALLEVLKDVSPETAATRPIAEAHTIWELVLHVKYWQDVVRFIVAGEEHELSEEENFPKIADEGTDAWDRAVASLVDSEKLLRDAILGLDDSRLEDRPKTKTVYELLHGVVQHNLYHAGQMALLKRAQLPDIP